MRRLRSVDVIVLTINLLSSVKKKKEPLLPPSLVFCDLLVLKICSRLLSGLSDSII